MCQHAHVCMPEGFPSLHSFLSPSLIINTIFFKDDALMLISGLTKGYTHHAHAAINGLLLVRQKIENEILTFSNNY